MGRKIIKVCESTKPQVKVYFDLKIYQVQKAYLNMKKEGKIA